MIQIQFRRLCLAGLLMLALATGSTLRAQESQPKPQEMDWLEDFIHYVLVARSELAHASAQALVDSPIADADLYTLIDDAGLWKRLDDAMVRSARIAELEDIAGLLQNRINQGRVDLARDPNQIALHIQRLVGSPRGRLLSEEALHAAGEYAVPQLLDVLVGSQPADLKARCTQVLIDIGRQAVTPLSIALPELDPVAQERVCNILGSINYYHALPALRDLAFDDDVIEPTRTAAQRAYAKLGGGNLISGEVLWLSLAEMYWGESRSLIAWPNEDTNNIWSAATGGALHATAVPTDIFSEVMAMKCCERVMSETPDSLDGLSLWIGANFRRADQLGDRQDPTYGPDRRTPLYYAVASGPTASQMVLDRANRDLNARLARHAIEALDGTGGGASLWFGSDRPSPLIHAMDFPERRVRYDAALALGRALPTSAFSGSDRVVPILSSAIRLGDERFAAVIANNEEDQRSLATILRDQGFTVLPPRSSVSSMRGDLAESPAVDLFVLMINADDVPGQISAIQSNTRVAASPIIVLAPVQTAQDLREAMSNNMWVSVVRLGLTDTQMATAINSIVNRTTGDLITGEEADVYARESLLVLRDIAVRNTEAFDITKSDKAVIEALALFSDDLRMAAATTLSWTDTARAQQALLDAALEEGDELTQALLFEFVANSAKRFGSYASDSQMQLLVDFVTNARGPVATAAAQAHGALNLPASNMIPLIVE